MKKLYFLVLALCLFNGLRAQVVNIPDDRFKKLLLRTPNIIEYGTFKDLSGNYIDLVDANKDGQIQESEALQISYMDVSINTVSAAIFSLDGIAKFTNLETLIINGNRIKSLDVRALKKLKVLVCYNNSLTYLNLSGLDQLESLNFTYNRLTSLNLSNLISLKEVIAETSQELASLNLSGSTNLTSFVCTDAQFTSLNLSGLTKLKSVVCTSGKLKSLDLKDQVDLEELDCNENEIEFLNFGSLSKIKKLRCSANKISSLDISNLVNLDDFDFTQNLISSIDFSKNLKIVSLACGYNQFMALKVNNLPELKYFSCDGNKLTSLDLSGMNSLVSMSCNSNLFESLDFSKAPNLEILNAESNQFVTLDVNSLTKLRYLYIENNENLNHLLIKNGSPENQLYIRLKGCPNLKYVCVDDFKFKKIQEFITQLGYNDCHINSYCSFVPGGNYFTIKGSTKYDYNSNGCDNNDLAFPNLKFNIANETTNGDVISNNLGNYSIALQAGTYSFTPILEQPDYFKITPSTMNVTFPGESNVVLQNFCVTANGIDPDLEITLLPINVARPGFDAYYKIVYRNKGNVKLSGTINLVFDDTILALVKSVPSVLDQAAKKLVWNFNDLMPFESKEILLTIKVNRPTEIPAVNNGDVLKFTAAITSQDTDKTPKDNTFTLNQIVVGSYDPNDKTCLEGSVITPDLIGEYVHYMIRFENTGTYPAQNIVVKDMIDLEKFDISTLIPTTSSHSFVTRISESNKVEFIFENINLPFDDVNNDGYVAFKIKTKSTLKVGDSFTNDANIYFDYNFPILTNKATSTFKSLGIEDFNFSKYLVLYPNPSNQILNISKNDNIDIQSFEIYDVLGQLVIAVPNAKTTSNIDVSRLTAGNYFIRVKSDKGSSSMKFIKI